MARKKEETIDISYLKKKSREYSIKDGIFATLKDSLGNSYISPFAIAMNSSDYLIAMLSSIPGLLGPICQWKSSKLVEKYPRKLIVVKAVSIEILTWIPLIILSLLYYFNILTNLLPFLLLIFFSIYIITANFGAPAWFSWIGDIIDDKDRGRWFAKRHFIFGFVTLISTLLAAIFLDVLKKYDLAMIGFGLLFFLAMISRIISRFFLKKMYEPPIKLEKGYYFTFREFIKKAPHNNFGRFTIFRALIGFSTMIAGPFFAVYMLKELKFNYLTFMLITMSQTFFTLIILKFWGRFSDKFGNYEVLRITSILIAIYPITWLISDNPIYLILGPQLIGGLGWAGFNLSASNYIFDCVTPQKRSLALSYYELMNGTGILLGGILGALLISYLNISFMNIILFVFLISGLARILIVVIMIPMFTEVKNKEKFESSELFKNLIFKTIRLPSHEANQGNHELRFHHKKL
ncbi:MAG: MFS transporter [Candidatus Pacearchaeota archaeon]|jgi:MFS family permease